jgi:hypothetical protein
MSLGYNLTNPTIATHKQRTNRTNACMSCCFLERVFQLKEPHGIYAFG